MKRIRFSIGVAAAGVLMATVVNVTWAATPGTADAVQRRPNIVMIVSDDHGTDALGCYGNPVIQTPYLDALAADGVRFTHAFCTTASCSPSRSVLLTGLHNHANGMYGLQHQEHHFQSFAHIKSLPVMLAKAGYRTIRIGKFHIAPESVYAFQTVLSPGAANDPASLGRSPVEMAEACRPIIEAENSAPFFLYFATDDPHRSNEVLPDGRPTFETWPHPNRFGNRPEGYPGVTPVRYDPAKVRVPSFLPDNPACRAELAEYYEAVSRLDQGVGRLLQILKDAGKYDSTLILYLSDNGVAFPNAKTTLYDSGMRLPLIARLPGVSRPGSVQDAMVSWVDITPTILDVAGVTPPGVRFHGRSFRAALAGDPVSGWDIVYGSHSFHEITMYYPMRVVRTRDFKLIHNVASGLTFPSALDLIYSPTWISVMQGRERKLGQRSIKQFLHRPEFELYDLRRDPNEVRNRANDPRYRAIRAALVEKLKTFQRETGDPWVHKWDYQ